MQKKRPLHNKLFCFFARHAKILSAVISSIFRALKFEHNTAKKQNRLLCKGLKNAGFTLYELLITIALIGILSSAAIPPFIKWNLDLKLNNSIRELQSDLQMAKLRAIKENAYTVITFDANNYIVFVDNGVNAGDWKQDKDELILIKRQIPSGVLIDLNATNFQNDRIRFNSRGNLGCRLGSVVLKNQNNKSKKIYISMFGRMNVNWQ